MKVVYSTTFLLVAASCHAFVPLAPRAFVPHHAGSNTAIRAASDELATEMSSLFDSMVSSAKQDLEEAALKMEKARRDLEELNASAMEVSKAWDGAKKEATEDLKALLRDKLETKVAEIKSMEEWKELEALSDEVYNDINSKLVELTGEERFSLDNVQYLLNKEILTLLNKAESIDLAEGMYPLFRSMSSFGFPLEPYVTAEFSLPTLVDVYNMAVKQDAIADRITGSLALELDQRVEDILSSLTKENVEEIGNKFQQEISALTGKDTYEFGDITRAVTKRLDEAGDSVETEVLIIGVTDDEGSSGTISVATNDPELKAELEALQEAMDKEEEEAKDDEEAKEEEPKEEEAKEEEPKEEQE